MLEIRQLDTGYDALQVLHHVSMTVQPGEMAALIGPNGSGKSTILKAVSGILRTWSGDIHFKDCSIANRHPAAIISMGLTFAPQGNRIFDELTVKENLEIGGFHLDKELRNERIEAVLSEFPVLRIKFKKNAGTLSGGEQQMLALGRALVPKPEMLLLDEPSLGLAPKIIQQVFEKLAEINSRQGVTMLIAEQKVNRILSITSRVFSLRLGRVAFHGSSSELKENKEKLRDLFLK